MADIAAGDVTYTIVERVKDDNSHQRVVADVAFGNGTLTYPSGGVPLTKASLACPNVVKELFMVNPASSNGFVYKYDATNVKVRIYQGDDDNVADAPLIELVAGTATPAAATLRVSVRGY